MASAMMNLFYSTLVSILMMLIARTHGHGRLIDCFVADMTYNGTKMAVTAEFVATPTLDHVTTRLVAGLQQGSLRNAMLKDKQSQ